MYNQIGHSSYGMGSDGQIHPMNSSRHCVSYGISDSVTQALALENYETDMEELRMSIVCSGISEKHVFISSDSRSMYCRTNKIASDETKKIWKNEKEQMILGRCGVDDVISTFEHVYMEDIMNEVKSSHYDTIHDVIMDLCQRMSNIHIPEGKNVYFHVGLIRNRLPYLALFNFNAHGYMVQVNDNSKAVLNTTGLHSRVINDIKMPYELNEIQMKEYGIKLIDAIYAVNQLSADKTSCIGGEIQCEVI